MIFNKQLVALRERLELQLIALGHNELIDSMTVQIGTKAQEGYYVTNVGFLLARKVSCSPQQASEALVAAMSSEDPLNRWEYHAVQGYINCKPSKLSLLQHIIDNPPPTGWGKHRMTSEKLAYAAYRVAFLRRAFEAKGYEAEALDLVRVANLLERPCFSGVAEWLASPESECGLNALAEWIYVLNRNEDLSRWDDEGLKVLYLLSKWAERWIAS